MPRSVYCCSESAVGVGHDADGPTVDRQHRWFTSDSAIMEDQTGRTGEGGFTAVWMRNVGGQNEVSDIAVPLGQPARQSLDSLKGVRRPRDSLSWELAP
ncbi:hypothetical protein GN244_ATG09594 [Phytophthora infestans]|uniref:Uncharacterized protein n=1 Tax=Phytophthora infestans TaxID=4787 RepID=A0A833TBR7_PHYIN|nr:hypothetical protein GN244_ATG09594 [Phytophthora infestans]KAF4134472.1 hypothetical protein GN958_ATG16353 [Phytophthora infestans]